MLQALFDLQASWANIAIIACLENQTANLLGDLAVTSAVLFKAAKSRRSVPAGCLAIVAAVRVESHGHALLLNTAVRILSALVHTSVTGIAEGLDFLVQQQCILANGFACAPLKSIRKIRLRMNVAHVASSLHSAHLCFYRGTFPDLSSAVTATIDARWLLSGVT
jgi:hypothetical protein